MSSNHENDAAHEMVVDPWPGQVGQILVGIGLALSLLGAVGVFVTADSRSRTDDPRWIAPGLSLATGTASAVSWDLPQHSLDGFVRQVR